MTVASTTVDKLPGGDRNLIAIRVLLLLVSVSSVIVGVWALAAPQGFYASFPGFGRRWISMDGPYNEHLIRDFGALNLALASINAFASARPQRFLVRSASLAGFLFAIPHLIYHVRHLEHLQRVDQIGNTIALGTAVALPAAALVLSEVRGKRR
jgi:hypothetical protein